MQSNYPQEALEPFTKAIKLGNKKSHYSIAMSYVSLGQITTGIEHLNLYLQHYPEDEQASIILKTLEDGDVEYIKE